MNSKQIMDEAAVRRALSRIAHEIVEKNNGAEDLILLGIKTRGVPIAATLAANIESYEGIKVPVGTLDITKHRDDLTEEEKESSAKASDVPFDLTGKTVILVDDVLFTGRSSRAAIETAFSFGRPRSLQLAVLVDRGHRELPISANYVGKNVPTALTEKISVRMKSIDGEDGVYILTK